MLFVILCLHLLKDILNAVHNYIHKRRVLGQLLKFNLFYEQLKFYYLMAKLKKVGLTGICESWHVTVSLCWWLK